MTRLFIVLANSFKKLTEIIDQIVSITELIDFYLLIYAYTSVKISVDILTIWSFLGNTLLWTIFEFIIQRSNLDFIVQFIFENLLSYKRKLLYVSVKRRVFSKSVCKEMQKVVWKIKQNVKNFEFIKKLVIEILSILSII